MSKWKDLFIASSKELRNLHCLTLCAMLGAVSIVIGSMTVMVGDFLKIGFSFLPNEFVFYMFGPFVGAIFGAAMDILTFIVRPTGTFFPGFTLSAIVTGIIFGILLYKKPLSLKRIFIANLVHLVLVNLLMNTYWLTILLGEGFLVLLPIRALKAIIMLPIETILLYTLIKGVEATGVLKKLMHKHAGI